MWSELFLHHFKREWNWNVKVRTVESWICGELWVDANSEMIKHFLECYGPNQKATEIFTPNNSNVVFEHLKMQIIFVLKLYLTLLGVLNILEKNLGMNLSSCFGIIDVFSLTILWATGFSNHSFLCILPLWQWKSLWTRAYTEYKFCFQIFFVLFSFIFFLTILEWIGEVVIESKPN